MFNGLPAAGRDPEPREPDLHLHLHHVPVLLQPRRRLHRLPTPGPRAGAALGVHDDDVRGPGRLLVTQHHDGYVHQGNYFLYKKGIFLVVFLTKLVEDLYPRPDPDEDLITLVHGK